VEANPTIKMLALSFLIMIGVMLVAEGLGTHINKGYVYFGMVFSLGVEMLNLWARKKNPHLAQVEANVSRGADI
jgi:predicted tellurium resistance membrane protein TerC